MSTRAIAWIALLFLATAAVLRGEGYCAYPMQVGSKLYVVEAQTGKAKAITHDLPLSHLSGPVVFKGVMLVGDPDNLAALDVRTGKTLWITQPGYSGTLLPTDDALYCDGFPRALNPKTGKAEWQLDSRNGSSNVLLTDDFLVTGKGYGSTLQGVQALDRKTGKQRWEAPLPGEPFTLTRAADLVFVGRRDEAQLLDLKSGRSLWQARSDWPVRPEYPSMYELASHFECDGQRIFRFQSPADDTSPGQIEALDVRTREVLWQTPLPARIDWQAALRTVGDLLFLQTQGEVYAFRPDTGKLQWQMDGVDMPYVGDATRVYVVDRRGGIRAVDRKTGKLEWRFDPSSARPGTHSFPTLALAGDSLYVVVNELHDPRWAISEPAEKRPLPR
jgi:outer membrane protein assembly factor BamB